MANAVETAARAAERAGARLSESRLPAILGEAFQAHAVIHRFEAALSLAYEHDRHRDRLGASLRDLIDSASTITPEAYDDARRTTSRARAALADLLNGIDVMLSASAPGAAPAGLTSTGTSTFNRLWTLMGTPSVNVPGLADSGGLPLGVQVIGRFGSDRATLEAARFIEAALAGAS
jgi:Asp-tRNA(Asn)/Glu-tRNA(Gln) amidotransferase A subunit family amidase